MIQTKAKEESDSFESKDSDAAVSSSRLENVHWSNDTSMISDDDEEDCENGSKHRNDEKSAEQFISVSNLDESEKSHIMISYCHKQKNTVQKLLWGLRKNEVENIWIDSEHMHTSKTILDEMANAVDGAKYVICCISRIMIAAITA